MKEIFGFIRTYYHEVNKPVLLLSTLYIGTLVWLNYGYDLESRLINQQWPAAKFWGHFLIYTTAFLPPYLLLLSKEKINPGIPFWICLLLAPAIFAIKVSMDTSLSLSVNKEWNTYWNDIIYWPLRMAVLVGILAVCKFIFHKNDERFGLSAKRFNLAPYLFMLMIMVPLITAASTQPDFLTVYPKFKTILPLPADAEPSWWYMILFEASYGTDFFSVEIFFRGFLVIGFMRWAGKAAILPMACFYCSIHFGKPLGECISSYFGGLLLGIVSYHTRSIYGGLIVHLGIAWLMELGGYVGNRLF